MRRQLGSCGDGIGISVKRSVRAVGSSIALGVLGSAACLLLLAACGSGSAAPASSTTSSSTSSSSSTPATGTSTTAVGSFAAYQSCLQAHGGTFGPGGGFGRGGGGAGAGGTSPSGATTTTASTTPLVRPPVSAAQQKAFAACASLRPAGGFGGRSGGAGGGFGGGGGFNSSNPAFVKFTACLTQHGIQAGSSVSRTSPAYQAAFSACRSLLPTGGGGGFGRGGGAGAPGGANGATFAKYQACLKQHGVRTGATGQPAAKLQAAITACRSVLPNGGTGSSQTTTTTPTTTG